MIGLLLKDLLSLKKQAVAYLAVAGFYAFLSFSNGNFNFFGWMLILLSIMMPLTAIAFDERAKWDKYVLTMPVSKTQVIIEKYLLGFLLVLGALIIYTVFSALYGIDILGKEFILVCAVMIGIAFFFFSLLMPVTVKLGTEKARITMLAIIMIPTLIVMSIVKSGAKMPSEETLTRIAYVIPVFLVLLVAGSMLLSISIYKNKEF
ncbi:MAG: ABC-2 transporter permease [Lachnospiraceae bacterium]|nr:ABC-2 transporter permease [Lachnospiraceae bacterium]